MNRGLVSIFIIQAILCFLAAILKGTYYRSEMGLSNSEPKSFVYLDGSHAKESILNFFTYLLLLNKYFNSYIFNNYFRNC